MIDISIFNNNSKEIPNIVSDLLDKMGEKSIIYSGTSIKFVLNDLEAGIMALGNVQINNDKIDMSDYIIKEINDVRDKDKNIDLLLREIFAKFLTVKVMEKIVEKVEKKDNM